MRCVWAASAAADGVVEAARGLRRCVACERNFRRALRAMCCRACVIVQLTTERLQFSVVLMNCVRIYHNVHDLLVSSPRASTRVLKCGVQWAFAI